MEMDQTLFPFFYTYYFFVLRRLHLPFCCSLTIDIVVPFFAFLFIAEPGGEGRLCAL